MFWDLRKTEMGRAAKAVSTKFPGMSFALKHASSNKCHARSNKCLTSSNKKLVVELLFFLVFYLVAGPNAAGAGP